MPPREHRGQITDKRIALRLFGDKDNSNRCKHYCLQRMRLAVDRMNRTPHPKEWEHALHWATTWEIASRRTATINPDQSRSWTRLAYNIKLSWLKLR